MSVCASCRHRKWAGLFGVWQLNFSDPKMIQIYPEITMAAIDVAVESHPVQLKHNMVGWKMNRFLFAQKFNCFICVQGTRSMYKKKLTYEPTLRWSLAWNQRSQLFGGIPWVLMICDIVKMILIMHTLAPFSLPKWWWNWPFQAFILPSDYTGQLIQEYINTQLRRWCKAVVTCVCIRFILVAAIVFVTFFLYPWWVVLIAGTVCFILD